MLALYSSCCDCFMCASHFQGIILYFIPGFVAEADRFFFYLLLLFSISSAMSQMFRTITYLGKNADVAQSLNMPFVMLFVVFGGFLIPRSEVPNWLIWAYYLSPFSWAQNSLALNEFTAGKYSGPGTADPTITLGQEYLRAFGLRDTKIWQWAGIIYLWGFYVTLTLLSTGFLMMGKPTPTMGAKRGIAAKKKTAEAKAVEQSNVVIDVQSAPRGEKKLGAGAKSSAKASFQLNSMPFTPATLAWKDIKYTVYVVRFTPTSITTAPLLLSSPHDEFVSCSLFVAVSPPREKTRRRRYCSITSLVMRSQES